ncbi:chaperonin 10-like protein [Mycena olivaceomarginata]|nr:chaperonin 10-like protein [Mycena olivaceomarginata]
MPSDQLALELSPTFDFSVISRDIPSPGPGQLLVKVTATALNPGDWKVHKFGILIGDPPAQAGMDAAGIVESGGQGVEDFRKGERVIYQGKWTRNTSSFQQFMIADSKFTAKIPLSISDDAAASVPVGLLAAWTGLYNPVYGAGVPHPFTELEISPPVQPLIVLGGASSVGQYVLQLARLARFSPIITTASAHHDQYLKSLGATHVLDRNLSLPELSKKIHEITKEPIKIVYDAISTDETQQAGYALLAEDGVLLAVDARLGEFTQEEQQEIKTVEAPTRRTVYVKGLVFDPDTSDLAAELYRRLPEMLKDGTIKPNRTEVLPGGLHGIVGGLETLEKGQVSGVKLVVMPQDTVGI